MVTAAHARARGSEAAANRPDVGTGCGAEVGFGVGVGTVLNLRSDGF